MGELNRQLGTQHIYDNNLGIINTHLFELTKNLQNRRNNETNASKIKFLDLAQSAQIFIATPPIWGIYIYINLLQNFTNIKSTIQLLPPKPNSYLSHLKIHFSQHKTSEQKIN